MRLARRLLRLLAFTAVVSASWGVPAQETPCAGKNHFILREPCLLEMRLSWATAAQPPFHFAEGHAATLLADGRVLVVGGAANVYNEHTRTWNAASATAIYDPARDTWSEAGTIVELRSWGSNAVSLPDGRVLMLGGETLYQLKGGGQIFDPLTGSWSPIANMLVPRVSFTATLLPDGRVLVVGGVDRDDMPVGLAEIYDPIADRWHMTGPMLAPRWGHTATALADGRVFVVGGVLDDWLHVPAELAEIFDPLSGTWKEAGEGLGAWMHTSTLLPDGRVLVAGGTRHDCPPQGGMCSETTVDKTRIYDPRRDTWTVGQKLSAPRYRHLAIPMGRRGSVLFVGGVTGVAPVPHYQVAAVEQLERFSYGVDRWQPVASTNEAPPALSEFYSATRLFDGSILLLGGTSGNPRAALLR